MLHVIKRLQATTAILLYVAVVPVALTGDDPPSDETKASASLEADVDKVTPAEKTDASVANSDEQEAAAVIVANGDERETAAVIDSKGAVKGAEGWVCRKETPTGSHRTITACRRTADIEANAVEVERVMNRQRQYGNPSVTPEG